MKELIKTSEKPDPWSSEIKASDYSFNPLFNKYFRNCLALCKKVL